MPEANNLQVVPSLAERIAEMNKGGPRRVASIVPGSINVEARTVEIAFSSEVEVKRSYGLEILGHLPGEVDMSRLENGASLLMDHVWEDVIGKVEVARIDPDGKGRATVRFGRSARAEEIFQDVIDGIRTKVSVGYNVTDARLVETRDDDLAVFRITGWRPYEISFVSVPADDTVGVGRSEEPAQMEPPALAPENQTVPNTTTTGNHRQMPEDNINPAPNAADAARAAVEAAQARTASILEIGEEYGNPELASQFARKPDASVNDFMRALLADRKEKGVVAPNTDIGMSERDLTNFSVIRAARALLDPSDKAAQKEAGFEFEISAAAAKNQRQETGRFVIPSDVLRTPLQTSMTSRVMSTGSNGQSGALSSGGQTVETHMMTGSYIDILRNEAVFMRHARVVGGLRGKFDIPKQVAGATGYWLGEDDDTTETGIDFGQIHLSPKTLGAFSEITRHYLNQSSLDIEALTRLDLAIAMALTADKAGFYGTGSDHQPLGVYNQTGITIHENSGVYPTYAEHVAMETTVAKANASSSSIRYVGEPGLRGFSKTTKRFPTGQGDATIWEPGNSINGYPVDITNQVNDGDVFYGNFADVLVGMWGGLELMVDPYSGSKKGRVRLITFQDMDIALRRKESFFISKSKATP